MFQFVNNFNNSIFNLFLPDSNQTWQTLKTFCFVVKISSDFHSYCNYSCSCTSKSIQHWIQLLHKKQNGRKSCHVVIICVMFVPIKFYFLHNFQYTSCEFESCSGGVYSIHHYVIKFVSDLRQVGSFLRVLGFPPQIKLTSTIQLKNC